MITFNNTKTIYDLVKNVGLEYENKVFVRFEKDDTIFEKGYGTFTMDTMAVAAYIHGQNEKHGHPVHAAILGNCSYEYLTVLLGVPSGAGVSVPLDVKLSAEKMARNLKKADTDILFYDREFTSQAELLKELCPFIKRFICLQSRKNVRCVPMIYKVFRGGNFKKEINPAECAMIIFTSGTTGEGKGVMLSHGNIIDNMFCTEDQEEVCLNVLPIHHIFCISGDVFLVLRYGSTLCLCDDTSKMLYYIKLFQPTVMRVVPMIAKMLLNRIAILKKKTNQPLSEIKTEVVGKRLNRLVSGGGYLSESLSDALYDLGIVTGQGYGMSECSPKISVPDYKRKDKVASVGHLVTGCQMRIVDGEIQVKSPSVMMGYYNDEELTREAITEDGWLRTGDMGYIDEEDFVYLNGRKKNLIILSNGENVSPEMIEKCFDGDRLIADILAYGKGEIIAAEIYPNFEYAQAQGIQDIEAALDEIVKRHNEELPSYARIAQFSIRTTAFEKTSSNKIIRKTYFDDHSSREAKINSRRKPENDTQRKLYDLVANQIGNLEFGIDENFYQCGLDSLGSTMLINDLLDCMKFPITLSELMENPTVMKLEALMHRKTVDNKTTFPVQKVYPLTAMQKYFAYIIPGNTTGNLPFAFQLDKTVDLEQLKKAIYIVLDAHPSLKAVVKPNEQKYLAIYRDDSRVIDIPILPITDAAAEVTIQKMIKPYRYQEDDNLVHIALFEGEKYKYLFFDVAHLMGDGVTMNILMEDLCRAYNGEEVKKEDYTTYDYILEEQCRESNGIRKNDIAYINELMKDIKLSRSILNKSELLDLSEGKYASIRKRFERIARRQVLYYGKQHGVSENVMFLAAFNYCIRLFSNEDIVFSCSIHSGRTDSRWNRLAGALFETYYCVNEMVAHETVEDWLKKTGSQIMNTMKCLVSTPRQGEMFFQFQGDILEVPKIGGTETKRIHVQLDSLPFHLQVMFDDKGYYTELRYWENRFDREVLEIFLLCYEAVLSAMLKESSVRCLKKYLPNNVFPKHYFIGAEELNKAAGQIVVRDADSDENIKVYVFDKEYRKKPYGAWGTVYIMNYEPENFTEVVQYPYGEGVLYGTGLIGRILPDGSIDFLHKTGRVVLTDGVRGRKYYDLKLVEETLLKYRHIRKAECYLAYDTEINALSLHAELSADKEVDIEMLKEDLGKELEDFLIPKFIHIQYIE